MRKGPFIDGFKEPTLQKNSYLMLSDVRGDGQGKLIIWSQQQTQLIVYKGANRQVQKQTKVRNVSSIIEYYDQQTNTKPVIALAAQNGLYIFRGLQQSFRLRIPDIFAQVQQQIVWSQNQNNIQKITKQLTNINFKLLSQTGKYYLGSKTQQRKRQLINKVFSQGINQKDSISALTVIKDVNKASLGNVVIGTQLKRLYILDNFGHSIIQKIIINFTPALLFAYGRYTDRYIIISIGREGIIEIYGNTGQSPIETIKITSRIVSAVLNYPDFIIATDDQIITYFTLSNSNFKIAVKKKTIKLNKQPIKLQIMNVKNTYKCLLVAFSNQVRVYYQYQLIYTHKTDYVLYNIIFGSFSREEGCLVLLYQKNGFQVLILHRQFNPKEKYGSNKIKITETQIESIPIPKKTNHFLTFWKNVDDNNSYKLYEKSIRLLKWRTLKQKFQEKGSKSGKIQMNSKIQGLGPIFIIKLEIENITEKAIYEIDISLLYDKNNILVNKSNDQLKMLAPFIPYNRQIQITSKTLKNQQIVVQLSWQGSIVSTTVFIPNCQQIGQ